VRPKRSPSSHDGADDNAARRPVSMTLWARKKRPRQSRLAFAGRRLGMTDARETHACDTREKHTHAIRARNTRTRYAREARKKRTRRQHSVSNRSTFRARRNIAKQIFENSIASTFEYQRGFDLDQYRRPRAEQTALDRTTRGLTRADDVKRSPQKLPPLAERERRAEVMSGVAVLKRQQQREPPRERHHV
jgi:hypothetical protein